MAMNTDPTCVSSLKKKRSRRHTKTSAGTSSQYAIFLCCDCDLLIDLIGRLCMSRDSEGSGSDSDSDSDQDSDTHADTSEVLYEEPEDYCPKGGPDEVKGPSFASISTRRWRQLEWHRKWHYFKR